MEIQSFYCQGCSEKTLYNLVKPRFCSACGQPFAVFANKVTAAVSAPKVIQGMTEQDLEDEELALSKIKTASYYRARAKEKRVEVEDNMDNLQDEDDGDDFQGGDPDFRGSGNQPNLLDVLSNGTKKNTGVKFSDIIRKEPSLSNDSAQPVKTKTAKASSPKATGAKRGRPSKKT